MSDILTNKFNKLKIFRYVCLHLDTCLNMTGEITTTDMVRIAKDLESQSKMSYFDAIDAIKTVANFINDIDSDSVIPDSIKLSNQEYTQACAAIEAGEETTIDTKLKFDDLEQYITK